MSIIVEDLIKMLDGIGNGYRRGRHPDSKTGGKVASVLRAVADELEL
jgi:CspA family cold shock protein